MPALQIGGRSRGFILSAARTQLLEAPSLGETHDPIPILQRGLRPPGGNASEGLRADARKPGRAGLPREIRVLWAGLGVGGGGGGEGEGQPQLKGDLDPQYILKKELTETC